MSTREYAVAAPGVPVILANGRFPAAASSRAYLAESRLIICCDGAVDKLLQADHEPAVIVGDMDSISATARERYGDRLVEDRSQETNDLTKAVEWALGRGLERVVILGGDGERIDHTIANAALLAEHCAAIDLAMVTDDGVMVPVAAPTRFHCVPGQQVSIFSLEPGARFRTRGLRYELDDRDLARLWSGSLNEALADEFTLSFTEGRALVFLAAGH